MANDEHVALLKKGVAAWNAWRDKYPNVLPDLSHAHLDKEDRLPEALTFFYPQDRTATLRGPPYGRV